jgi:hypothetical protein
VSIFSLSEALLAPLTERSHSPGADCPVTRVLNDEFVASKALALAPFYLTSAVVSIMNGLAYYGDGSFVEGGGRPVQGTLQRKLPQFDHLALQAFRPNRCSAWLWVTSRLMVLSRPTITVSFSGIFIAKPHWHFVLKLDFRPGHLLPHTHVDK